MGGAIGMRIAEKNVILGKYDPSFTVAGAWKYKDDVPTAQVHIVDGGHFALDEAEPEILRLMQDFLKSVIKI
jgi:surfactin synthase thioesterase subunit